MKIKTIIKKEYNEIVKKKSFIISTILTPLIMGLFFFLPMLISQMGRSEKTIEIMDYSGIVGADFIKQAASVKESLKLNFRLSEPDPEQKALFIEHEKKVAQNKKKLKEKLQKGAETAGIPDMEMQDSVKEIASSLSGLTSPVTDKLKMKILTKEVDGIIFISPNLMQNRKIYFYSTNISDFATNRYMSSTIKSIVSGKLLKAKIKDAEIVNIVKDATRDISTDLIIVKKEGTAKSSSKIAYMMAMFMMSILFGVMMGYGQLIMRSILEEKNSRIAEVLISCTDPYTLFYGKIIGIGLAGLTQVGIWISLIAVGVTQASFLHINASVTSFLTFDLAFYFLIFFILGYFMFAVMFSIVGASVNTDQEAQQFSAPITYMLILPFLLSLIITQNPDSLISVISSLIPFFSPTLMFMRISVTMPPLIQIIASIIMSTLFIIFLAWIGAKIFRVGILMYGKKPSVKEIIRWIRYK